MTTPDTKKDNRKQYFSNLALTVVAGQVGCLTLVIVLGAVFLGLWLDNHFDTRPVLTLITVLASVPVSLVAMFVVARGAANRIKLTESNVKGTGQDNQQ
jgi:MFS-type transporter involved in bile tolerance (Atg22 family)